MYHYWSMKYVYMVLLFAKKAMCGTVESITGTNY